MREKDQGGGKQLKATSQTPVFGAHRFKGRGRGGWGFRKDRAKWRGIISDL